MRKPPQKTPQAWIRNAKTNPHACIRLFCFPYAGGGASTFRWWPKELPPEWEVCPIQLPGREGRFQEEPYRRITTIVEDLADLLPSFLDLPFGIFGYSLGGIIGFELTRALRRRGLPQPFHLIVAACEAPHARTDHPPTYNLPKAEFIHSLRKMGGTPELVLDNPDLFDLFIPLLRADFEANETYVYQDEPPLACPISAYGGLEDKSISRNSLEMWQEQTTNSFNLRLFPGDHFFIRDHNEQLLNMLARDIENAIHITGGI